MHFRLIVFVALAFSSFDMNAQLLYFNLTDGTSQQYAINEVRRIDFDAKKLNLLLTDETVISIELDALLNYQYKTDAESISEHPSLDFYPNPADFQLKVRFTSPQTKTPFHIRVHNLKGEQLIEQTLKLSENGAFELDVSRFFSGQYICTLSNGDIVISKSFIKL